MSLIKTLVSVTRLSHLVMLQLLRIGGAGEVGGWIDGYSEFVIMWLLISL